MKVVDLHPDDLLDKDARGELSEGERARLEAHLERCDTCRFEREVRADFADELSDDEEEIPSQRLVALMEGLPPSIAPPKPEERKVDEEAEEETPAPTRISSRPAAVRRNVRLLLLVAAALLVGSAATAGIGTHVWAHVAAALSLDTEGEHTGTTSTPTTLAPKPAPRPISPPVATELLVAPEPSQAAAIEPVSLAPTAPVESAASLFEAANHARNAGDYGRAVMLHRRLEATYPSSREAHVSYATLGRLLLDRGDPSGALGAFDAYRAKGPGPMDEAVVVGRATALERLGRDAEARMTWTQLLHDFPDTPYREHAEARLEGAAR